jgi:peptide chain release factor 1
VLPAVDEVEVQINEADLRIDVFRSSGHGGQSVNTTDSAVRITHLPTGLVVSCQDEKSQLKNKVRAMQVLRARLYAMEQERAHAEVAEARRAQVGTGERAEKIRTYNFPQNRVTDHRIGLTLHSLDRIMAGELSPLIEALSLAEGGGEDGAAGA